MDPIVDEHVGDLDRCPMPRDPAGGADVVAAGGHGKVLGDLGDRAGAEPQRPGRVVREPEGDEPRAGELRGRRRDHAQQRVEIERARDALVDGRQRARPLGLRPLGLVEPGVADGHARLSGQELQDFLLLAVGQAAGKDVVEHADEGLAHDDGHTTVAGRGALAPPIGRHRARMGQGLGDEDGQAPLDDEARQPDGGGMHAGKALELGTGGRRELQLVAVDVIDMDRGERARGHGRGRPDDALHDVLGVERRRDRLADGDEIL